MDPIGDLSDDYFTGYITGRQTPQGPPPGRMALWAGGRPGGSLESLETLFQGWKPYPEAEPEAGPGGRKVPRGEPDESWPGQALTGQYGAEFKAA